jgi:amino acid adenylation domain-containing protein
MGGLATTVDLLRSRTKDREEALAYVFLADGETESARLSYGRLDQLARSIAVRLRDARGAGERALLLYPSGLEFIAAFLGCTYARAVAVPSYPPAPRREPTRLISIVRDCSPRLVLTNAAILGRREALLRWIPELAQATWIDTGAVEAGDAAAWRDPGVKGENLAFLQYTSASTAAPKGVMVSHRNLIENQRMIREAFGHSEHTRVVSWLPLFHDMGLIGCVLQPLYLGVPCVLMSPAAFLQRPIRWLEAISRFRGTTSGGPNFAYDLLCRKARPAELERLDLSSWDVAFNGAEPVRADTLERFAETFAPCGFRREAFLPCYGLAESTLLVSGGGAARPALAAFDARALEEDRVCEAAEGHRRRLVGCGRLPAGQEAVIVDPRTCAPCGPDRVGEIWIRGPSTARGYWSRPAETASDFGARLVDDARTEPFLRTGDLGFIKDGELFVAGRLKDLVIVRGRNHHPQDLEASAERGHSAARPGGGAAFSIEAPNGERLVLVQELEHGEKDNVDLEEAAAGMRRAVMDDHELALDEVAFIRAGALPRTSSGKVQRRKTRDLYRAGQMDVVGCSRLAAIDGLARGEPWGEAGEDAAWTAEALRALALPARRTVLEEGLKRRAAAILGVSASRLDAEIPLAGMGLDSLNAVELRASLEEAFGVAPSFTEVAELGLGELARRMASALDREGPARPPLSDAPPAPGSEMPLSWGQQELWLAQRLAPASPVYHVVVAARLDGALDVGALERALTRLTRRHDSWRTTFHETGEGPRQRLEARSAVDFSCRDASSWSGERVTESLREAADRPFDLAAGPLLRVAVLRLGEREYRIVWVVHHLVADLWSLSRVAVELGELYQEETGGAPARSRPGAAGRRRGPETSHAAFVEDQRRLVASEEGRRLERYWRERLEPAPEPLELAADRPPAAARTYAGAALPVALGPARSERLFQVARRHRAGTFVTLLTLFKALLYRRGGQDDVVVGSPAAGRSRAGLESVVGYLVRMLALRTDLAGRPSLIEALGRVGRGVAAAWDHQEYPLSLLSGPDAGEGAPRYRAVFALQRPPRTGDPAAGALALGAPGVGFRLGPLRFESLALGTRAVPFDLSLLAAESGGEVRAVLQYSTELFDAASAQRCARQLAVLMDAALADPGLALAELPLLDAAQRGQLLREWNDTRHPSVSAPVQARVRRQARRRPDAVAVTAAGEAVTYGELEARASALASRLRALGVGPDGVVAVCLERSPWMVAALLGVLEAGGAYLPIDPEYPIERVKLTLTDARPLALVGDPPPARRHALAPARIVAIDDGTPSRGRAAPAARGEEKADRRLAYVIYTSGSTGRPKGVAISHASLANLADWHHGAYDLAGADRVAQVAAPGFDATVWDVWTALTAGACLCLCDAAARLDPARLTGWMERERITVGFLPTPLMEACLALPEPGGALRLLLTGGDRLRVRPPASWRCRLVNHYGPTESTVVASAGEVPAAGRDGAGGPPPTLGRPIANFEIRVVDAHDELAPPGVPGELRIGGGGLARGYLHGPALTADRFRPDPWSGAGGRLYRSGDRARLRGDGEIEFLGRGDRQLKVRGFRVEAGEVETVLRAHPEVAEAVVDVRGPDGLAPRLVAWIVPARQPFAGIVEVRRALEKRLPSYMVPAAWAVLAELPLTAHGKLDRRALPEPGADGGRAPRRPRTPTEEILAGIWSELLGGVDPGAEESFFELGGSSLPAARLVSRVRDALEARLELREVFEHPRLGEMAALVEASRGAALPPPITPAPRPADGRIPLSFGQERLWFLDRLDPRSAAYNVPMALECRGRLRLDVLEACLAEIAARHEVLLSSLPVVGEGPVQAVAPPARLTPARVDLGGLPAGRRARVRQRLAGREAATAFDLSTGPLWRVLILTSGEREHTVVLTFHHAVVDGASIAVFWRELGALYRAMAAGEPSPLPPLPLRYADYALWQRRRYAEDGALGLEYWRRQLEGAPETLELPVDRPFVSAASARGASLPLSSPAELTSALELLGRRSGATLFMVLLAAFASLLARWSRQRDLVVGSPVAGRGRVELEGLIGLFVNTVALRVEVAQAWRFTELLARVRRTALGAYEHGETPFSKVVEELRPQRSRGRSPLFQVLLALDEAPPAPPELPELDLLVWKPRRGASQLDLTLSLARGEAALEGEIEYRRDLFDHTTVRRLRAHFLRLLAEVTADPGRRLGELALLSGGERRQVLDWSGWAAPDEPAGASPVHERIALQAGLRPDAVAVESQGAAWSHAGLDVWASRLARRLAGLGVGPEVRVGLELERSPAMIAALLAVQKAGAVFVVLDPSYPPYRLALLREDARPAVVVDRDWVQAGRHDASSPASLASPRDPGHLAYVLYTSGSTGRPKGVCVSYGALARHCRAIGRSWELEAGDRVLQFAAPGFDAALEQILPTLACGATLVLRGDELEESRQFLRSAATLRLTVANLPTAYFEQLASDPEPEPAALALRLVMAGGEALAPEAVRRWRRRHPAVRLANAYGPTEGVVTAAVWDVEVGGIPAAGATPIGRPTSGRRLYVAERSGELAPAAVTGELRLAGPILARGYLGLPGHTAASFVPDAVSGVPGGRLYCTGDLVRWLPGGVLQYLGRSDRQVQIRGFRVEPGEVEAAVAAHPEVAAAVVVPSVRPGGESCLVAYVTPAGEPPPGGAKGAARGLWPRRLAEHLRGRLPAYMAPAAWVVLDALPRTVHGKVDLAALPAPHFDLEPKGRAETPDEQLLAAIWAQALGLEEVGADDDFFLLGGHSLLATQVAARARRAFGVELPVSKVFEAHTVRALARELRALRRPVETAPIEPGGGDEAPLSPAQQRLWFLDRLDPGTPAYNVAGALGFHGELDPDALAAALGHVMSRQEALRTHFAEGEGGPVQRVAPWRPPAVATVDLRRLPAGRRQGEARRLGSREARRPFDLTTAPLLRLTLLRRAAAEHVGILTIHHIVADGWSLTRVLPGELLAAYRACRAGEAPRWEPLRVRYADYARWLAAGPGGAAAEDLAWWRRRLAGAPGRLELPLDRPRPRALTPRGGLLSRPLAAPLARAAESWGRSASLSPFLVYLTAFGALLSRLTHQRDLLIGFPAAGRESVDLEPLVGMFVNPLVLRLEIAPGDGLGALARTVRGSFLESYDRGRLPFERLLEGLRPERGLDAAPLFQVMFATLDTVRRFTEGGLEVSVEPIDNGTAKFELDLTVERDTASDVARWEYSTDLFDATTVRRFADGFAAILAAGLAAPERPLHELGLLGGIAGRQLLVEWNDVARSFSGAAGVGDLVLRRAARQPDAAAVVSTRATLTYGELTRRGAELARRLRSLGVGPERRVGVCLERSAAQVMALLGTWLAGGAYMPIDPRYPDARIVFMVRDAGLTAVVTDKSLARRLPARAPVVLIDPSGPVPFADAEGSAAGVENPDQLAYVIYTSGSTGHPKGVAVTHRTLHNLIGWHLETYGLTAGDRVGQVAGAGFDASVWDVWTALAAGAALCLADEVTRVDAERLNAWLAGRAITVAFLPTPLLEACLDQRAAGGGALRYLLTGGDRLRRFRTPALACALVNHYGPAEATVVASAGPVPVSPARRRAPPSIGRPIANVWLEAVDARGAPVPRGVTGELRIGGGGVARCYLGRPGLTAERFVPAPRGGAGDRLYVTGDLVRHRHDGELEFLGRRDHQVQIRGLRVEPGEIERALLAHPAVGEAAVVLRRDAAGEGRLAAYVAPVPGGDGLDVAVLRGELGRQLPAPMVPTLWVEMAALPKDAHGKLDRGALPPPGEPSRRPAPRTPREREVARIWSEILGVESIGPEDDFFELGGHSLQATRLLSRVRDELAVEVDLRRFFEAPRLGALSELIDRQRASGTAAAPLSKPKIRRLGRGRSDLDQMLDRVREVSAGAVSHDRPGSLGSTR